MVIVFYPFTFTGVCQGELCSLRDDLSEFQAVKAQVLAISCDSRHAQKQWSEQQGFTFPVLSDFWPHGEVARAYGVFNEQLGCANRATFVIDPQGDIERDNFFRGTIAPVGTAVLAAVAGINHHRVEAAGLARVGAAVARATDLE